MSLTRVNPYLTSNTAPRGVASASSEASSTYSPWKAFDSNGTSYWKPTTLNTGWLQYDFGAGYEVIAQGYALIGFAIAGSPPSAWTFEGSNDGSTWVVLDTRSGQNLTSGALFSYTCSNSTRYRYYRLNISASYDGQAPTVHEFAIHAEKAHPSMTSNTSPEGVVAATTFIAGNEAWKAFDGSTSTFWNAASGDPGDWTVRYEFPATAIIQALSLLDASTSNYYTNILVQASNDATAWDTLITISGSVPSTTTPKLYYFANTTAYKYYAIRSNAKSGSPGGWREVQFFGRNLTPSTTITASATPSTATVDTPSTITINASNAGDASDTVRFSITGMPSGMTLSVPSGAAHTYSTDTAVAAGATVSFPVLVSLGDNVAIGAHTLTITPLFSGVANPAKATTVSITVNDDELTWEAGAYDPDLGTIDPNITISGYDRGSNLYVYSTLRVRIDNDGTTAGVVEPQLSSPPTGVSFAVAPAQRSIPPADYTEYDIELKVTRDAPTGTHTISVVNAAPGGEGSTTFALHIEAVVPSPLYDARERRFGRVAGGKAREDDEFITRDQVVGDHGVDVDIDPDGNVRVSVSHEYRFALPSKIVFVSVGFPDVAPYFQTIQAAQAACPVGEDYLVWVFPGTHAAPTALQDKTHWHLCSGATVTGAVTDAGAAVEVNITGQGILSGTLSITHQDSITRIAVRELTGVGEVRGKISVFEAGITGSSFMRKVSSTDSENSSYGYIRIDKAASLDIIYASGAMVTYVRRTRVTGLVTVSGTTDLAQGNTYWTGGSAGSLTVEKQCIFMGHIPSVGTINSFNGSAIFLIGTNTGSINTTAQAQLYLQAASVGVVNVYEVSGEAGVSPYNDAAVGFFHRISSGIIQQVSMTDSADLSVEAGFITEGVSVSGAAFLRIMSARIGSAGAAFPSITLEPEADLVLHDCALIAGASNANSVTGTGVIKALGTINATKVEAAGITFSAGGIQVNTNVL